MGGRLVLYIGRITNEGVSEQSAEDDIWTDKVGSSRMLEKIAL